MRDLINIVETAMKFKPATPRAFVKARDSSARASFLSPSGPEDLLHHTLTTDDGRRVGYALDKNKDLQNLYSNSARRGAGREALRQAIKDGAKTLDAFDGYLTALYARHGFVETGRLKFDDEHAPDDWDYKRYGRPDVVFMAYRGGNRGSIDKKTSGVLGMSRFPARKKARYFDSYEAAKMHQSRVANNIEARSKRPVKENMVDSREVEKPLTLLETASRMPQPIREWIGALDGEDRRTIETILNNVGLDAFIEEWEFHKNELRYWRHQF